MTNAIVADSLFVFASLPSFSLDITQAFTFAPGMDVPAIPSDRDLYVKLNKDMSKFLNEYKIKPNPSEELGGLEDILGGFKRMQEGKVSGKKLTYKIGA